MIGRWRLVLLFRELYQCTRIGALGSVEQEVVSAALTVGASISAIVTPGVSTE
mgnify:CR=1 FL=1